MRRFFLLALFMACAAPATAKFASVETKRVPVERLLKKFEGDIRPDSKDAEALLHSARLHAMAYALKTEEAVVQKGAEDQPFFGYDVAFVPFQTKAVANNKLKKAAADHLDKAVSLYTRAQKLVRRTTLLNSDWLGVWTKRARNQPL